MPPTLKLENSLALENSTLCIVEEIAKQMKDTLKNVSDKKMNTELTKALCKLAIKLVKKTTKGENPLLTVKQAELINKEALVLAAIHEVFGALSEQEEAQLKDQITFMIDNKLLRNKSFWRKIQKKVVYPGLRLLRRLV